MQNLSFQTFRRPSAAFCKEHDVWWEEGGEEGLLYKSSQSVAVLQGRSLQQPLLPFPITGSTNTRISVNAILLNECLGR